MDSLLAVLYRYQYKCRNWFVGKTVAAANSISGKKSIPFDKELKKPDILFVMTGLIGDSSMCTPVFIQAKKIWPGCRVTLLGNKPNIELLQDCPYIDNFYQTPYTPFPLGGWKGKKELLQWLKAGQFDLSIILLADLFAKILYDADITWRVGVKGSYLQSCLTHTYDIVSPQSWTPAIRLNALRCLGYEVPDTLPQLWVNEKVKATALTKLTENGLTTSKYIVLHPFGSTRRQWWGIEQVPQLVNELYAKYQLKTVLIGGKETAGIILPQENLVDTTGKLTLQELKAVIAGAAMVITTDSGPFHIAGAFEKKIVGLFRSRRPELGAIYPTALPIFGKNDSCQANCKWNYCREESCLQLKEISLQTVLDYCGKSTGV